MIDSAGRWATTLVAAFSLTAGASACTRSVAAGPRTIHVRISLSRFAPDAIEVRRGDTVRFVLENADPIAHEFVIGTHAEQMQHESGADTTHNGVAGQASLPSGETRTLMYTFAQRGPLEFACHRPGHYAYGMRGLITVR